MSLITNKPGFATRISKLASRSLSFSTFAKSISEELFVRAYTNPIARRVMRKFVPSKYPPRWIFIVGCYNSGTTLLQKILGAHPQVSALPREGVRFTNWLSNLELNDHHMMWDENYKDVTIPEGNSKLAYEGIIADWRIFWKKSTKVCLEKSIANTARIEWLNSNFPNAYFLGIHRNGYCISEGLHRRARPPQWLKDKTGKETYSLSMTANQWVIANQDMLDGMAKVERKQIIEFEEFVAEPYSYLCDLFEKLELSTDCLQKTQTGISINGQSFDIKNPNPKSLERLSNEDINEVTPVIAQMMNKLNYPLISGE